MSFSKIAKGHASDRDHPKPQHQLITSVLVGQPSVIKVVLIGPECGETECPPAGPGQFLYSLNADFWISMWRETHVYGLIDTNLYPGLFPHFSN